MSPEQIGFFFTWGLILLAIDAVIAFRVFRIATQKRLPNRRTWVVYSLLVWPLALGFVLNAPPLPNQAEGS